MQVCACGGIGILVDDEAGAGVLEEDGGNAGGDAALRHRALHLIGDVVGALALGAHGEGAGMGFHGCGRYGLRVSG